MITGMNLSRAFVLLLLVAFLPKMALRKVSRSLLILTSGPGSLNSWFSRGLSFFKRGNGGEDILGKRPGSAGGLQQGLR